MNLEAIKESRVYKFFIIWHILATLFSLLIGILENDYSLAIALIVWTIIVAIVYNFRPKFFVLTAFILAVIEEWLVYELGGGLQGEAISLTHDFVNALPVFLGIILGAYFVLKRYDVREVELYILVGLVGSFVELVFQGIIFNPILLFLLGGPNFFIYGSIVVAPEKIEGEKEFGPVQKIFSFLFIVFTMIIGAIIADNLNTAFGFP